MLNDLGFNITVKSMEYTEYKNALLQGNFDLYYGEVRLSPNFDLSPFFGATGTLNYGSLSDSTMMTRGAVTEPTHYIDWFLPYTPEEGN